MRTGVLLSPVAMGVGATQSSPDVGKTMTAMTSVCSKTGEPSSSPGPTDSRPVGDVFQVQSRQPFLVLHQPHAEKHPINAAQCLPWYSSFLFSSSASIWSSTIPSSPRIFFK